MNRRYFEKKIINLIPSLSMKEEIVKTKHHFTDLELLAMIDKFENIFSKRIYLYNQAKKVFNDKKILSFINRYIKKELKKYEELINNINESEIYEVFIRSNPNSYEEHYLCPTYESCFNTIINFYKCYKDFAEVTELSEFTIQKRIICDRKKVKDMDKDIVITADFDYKMRLKRIYSHGTMIRINGFCLDEIGINYPHLFNGKELVSFKENNIVKYGVNCFDDYEGDSCVNYLDTSIIKDRLDMPRDYLISHTHLDFGFLEIVNLNNISEDLKNDYLYALNLLEKAHAFREEDYE